MLDDFGGIRTSCLLVLMVVYLVYICCVEWGLIQVHVMGSYFQVIMLCFSKGGLNHHLYTISNYSNQGVSVYITCTPSHSL